MPTPNLLLWPPPRTLAPHPGFCKLTAAQARALTQLAWPDAGVRKFINPLLIPQPEGYRLLIQPNGITVLAHDQAGAFYAGVTLRQILRQSRNRCLPCLRIEDWPDLPHRGYMLDISRDRVPTMSRLRTLVETLAELKLNQLQLYTEHTFAYRKHETVWREASPLTAAEIRELDALCRARHIELVPNQNSFGHMERWLRHPAYKPLAECPNGFQAPWGFRPDPSTLNPSDSRSLKLIAGLYEELLPNFTSRQLNVGCDETWELGQGRSKALCARRGKHRVYLDFLRKLHALARRHGRTMQFWGDIILHEPELIAELPPDVIALEWGYEANHPFAEHLEQFAASGITFYVCPGTSTWNSLGGRTTNALANLKSAAQAAVTHHAAGYLITDWGDNGHLQPPAVSYLPLTYGAGVAWNVAAADATHLPQAVSLHVVPEVGGTIGQIMYDLGNAYLLTKQLVSNATCLGQLLISDPRQIPAWLTARGASHFTTAARRIADLRRSLKSLRPRTAAARLLVAELDHAGHMMEFAAHLGAARCRAHGYTIAHIPATVRQNLARDLQHLIADHRRLWRASSRPGGLKDSTAILQRLETALQA